MSIVAKSPPEEKLLRTLWNRGPLTRGAARADADTVRRLVALNLIEEQPPEKKRASPKLALTSAGRVAAQKLPPDNPTQLDVFRQVALLREELEALRLFVAEHLADKGTADPEVAAPPPPPRAPLSTSPAYPKTLRPAPVQGGVPLELFSARVREAAMRLDRQERLGGLIPLPLLRTALQDLDLSRAAFDDALLALEEQFDIDLKVANDPGRLADADLGIDTPDRGLLYFVVVR